MLEIAGEPNLARVIALMRDQLRIDHVVIITGAFGEMIRDYFGDGTRFGVRLTYVVNDAVDKGLSYSLLLSRPHVRGHFCVILADECYLDSNHEGLLRTNYRDCLATCAVMATDRPEQVRKNYAVEVEDGLIRGIVEKPKELGRAALLGLGTFIFSPEFYDHLEAAVEAPLKEGPNDPVSVLGRLCANGARVAPFYLRGRYVNINDRDELNLANYLVRSHDFHNRTLALVLMMNGSSEDSRRTLADFQALERFRQIVLVVPPGADVPAQALGGAVQVTAPSGQYGDMMQAGLDAADADILFVAYADGSFWPGDVPKFLEYLKDADLVVGTRTTRQLVQQGTNMRGIVRLAHIALAKFVEIVWWTREPRFTDVGCTYRALWGTTYRLVSPRLRNHGVEYSLEMLLETLKCRKRVIEISVSFLIRRKGVVEREQTAGNFFKMLRLIFSRRYSE
jgi:dTDP-glucose pyrophosphorylase